VPIALWTGLGLWRRTPTAIKAAYGLAGFLVLQGASVLAMGVVMLWRGDPTASPSLIYALAPIVVALGAATILLLKSYMGTPSEDSTGTRGRAATHA